LSTNIEAALKAHYRFLAEYLWFFAQKLLPPQLFSISSRSEAKTNACAAARERKEHKEKEIFAIFCGQYIATSF